MLTRVFYLKSNENLRFAITFSIQKTKKCDGLEFGVVLR